LEYVGTSKDVNLLIVEGGNMKGKNVSLGKKMVAYLSLLITVLELGTDMLCK
jgi:hypothetical protein